MTQYVGVDLLDVVPDAVVSTPEDVTRFSSLLDGGAGVVQLARTSDEQQWTRTFRYACHTAAEHTALLAFLDARAGRRNPCWVPTWNDDLTLAANLAVGATTLRVMGPLALVAAQIVLGVGVLRAATRHAVVLPYAGGALGPMGFSALTAPVDNGDGTVTLTLATAYGGPAASVGACRIAFLPYVRLADDAIQIDYSVPTAPIAALRFIELPYETP